MGRILAGLASFALAFATATSEAPAETPAGAVNVTTWPSGADVWLDGAYGGRAPVLGGALVPGRHALTLTKTGWVVQEVDVNVIAATTVMSSTALGAGPRALAGDASGKIEVREIPPGAQVLLDDAPFDARPGRELRVAAGAHRLTLALPHAKMTRAVSVLPDTTTQIVFRAPRADDTRSAVVAPAQDYLPPESVTVEGKKVVVRYGNHVVVAYLGDSQVRVDGLVVTYDGAPESIGGKLYLPLALLEKLTQDMANSR